MFVNRTKIIKGIQHELSRAKAKLKDLETLQACQEFLSDDWKETLSEIRICQRKIYNAEVKITNVKQGRKVNGDFEMPQIVKQEK